MPEHVFIYCVSSVSSYVGGDIVSGVLASGIYKDPKLTLFIDIGTNGEIVIGNQQWLACAACSAGPAFEGGGIKFGMRASAGRHRRRDHQSRNLRAHPHHHRHGEAQGHLPAPA